jgi:hypothetical protein
MAHPETEVNGGRELQNTVFRIGRLAEPDAGAQ